jgi:hypothetical protein
MLAEKQTERILVRDLWKNRIVEIMAWFSATPGVVKEPAVRPAAPPIDTGGFSEQLGHLQHSLHRASQPQPQPLPKAAVAVRN